MKRVLIKMLNPIQFFDSKKDLRFAYTLIAPALIVILSLLGYPLVFAFLQSLQEVTVLNQQGVFIGFQNYITALNESLFLTSLLRSFIFVGFSLGGSFIIGLIIAILLNRDIFGQRIFRALIILPFIISEVSIGVIWQWLLAPELGVINNILKLLYLSPIRWLGHPFWAMFSVIIANIWRLTPFVVLILLAGLQVIDKSYYEAAYVDGASNWQTFKYITVPMIKPMMLVSLVYLSFASFNQFATIFSLTGGGPGVATEVLALYMYYSAFKHFNFGYGSSIAIILFIINVVLSLSYSKSLERKEA